MGKGKKFFHVRGIEGFVRLTEVGGHVGNVEFQVVVQCVQINVVHVHQCHGIHQGKRGLFQDRERTGVDLSELWPDDGIAQDINVGRPVQADLFQNI